MLIEVEFEFGLLHYWVKHHQSTSIHQSFKFFLCYIWRQSWYINISVFIFLNLKPAYNEIIDYLKFPILLFCCIKNQIHEWLPKSDFGLKLHENIGQCNANMEVQGILCVRIITVFKLQILLNMYTYNVQILQVQYCLFFCLEKFSWSHTSPKSNMLYCMNKSFKLELCEVKANNRLFYLIIFKLYRANNLQ